MNDYVVIAPDGSLGFGHRMAAWRGEVGRPGPVHVALHPSMPLAGFVNDDGFRLDLPRNVRGALLLIALGAGIQPYAGPVVVTGWHGRGGDVCPLRPREVDHLTRLHADVGRALAREARADDSAIDAPHWPGWAADMRAIVPEVADGPAPTMKILEF